MINDFQNKKTEYLLKLALEEQLNFDDELKKYDELEAENETHIFSKEHNKKMKRIYKMAKRAENPNLFKKRIKYMVAGFAVFISVSTLMVTQIKAFRVPVIKYISQIKEKYSIFDSNIGNVSHLSDEYSLYEPRYTPENFDIQEIHESESGFSISYINDLSNQYYNLYFFNEASQISLDTENASVFDLQINGHNSIIVEKGDEIKILMSYEESQYYLEGSLSIEEAIKIMESIR